MKLDNFYFPDNLLYMKGHIWIKKEGDEAMLGITSLGSSLAKEIVHVDLPEDNERFEAMEPIASFETIKSVTEISAPFDCSIMKINEKLLDDPSLINKDPYGDGWILKLKILCREDKDNIMDIKKAVKYYKKILAKEKERYKGIYE